MLLWGMHEKASQVAYQVMLLLGLIDISDVVAPLAVSLGCGGKWFLTCQVCHPSPGCSTSSFSPWQSPQTRPRHPDPRISWLQNRESEKFRDLSGGHFIDNTGVLSQSSPSLGEYCSPLIGQWGHTGASDWSLGDWRGVGADTPWHLDTPDPQLLC